MKFWSRLLVPLDRATGLEMNAHLQSAEWRCTLWRGRWDGTNVNSGASVTRGRCNSQLFVSAPVAKFRAAEVVRSWAIHAMPGNAILRCDELTSANNFPEQGPGTVWSKRSGKMRSKMAPAQQDDIHESSR
ncbi:hypothetical protein VTN49DRAFT_5308 [Thermomyces lanuginosus]|uniref:uncharacterized protein n=1 Tax=Thermomyces lanuginosus TaxID=5541 RepID=UPI003743127D